MVLQLGSYIHNNRYRIDAVLGQGGMGLVYCAWDMALNFAVAIKANLDISPIAHRQFMAEAQILARLSHPNLPRVSDYFVLLGQGQYLVMDLVQGEDLEAMLMRLGRLPEHVVLNWVGQVCDALAYLHGLTPPVIHRDIKPANIKIRPDGRAMLVDFGIAKTQNLYGSTTQGAKAITPGYSPPEQYGGAPTTAVSDIYALGATLYHALTGQTPPESVLLMTGMSVLPTPRQINPNISVRVEQAIVRAMALTGSQRYQRASDLRTALLPLPLAIGVKTPVMNAQLVTLPMSYTPPISSIGRLNRRTALLLGGSLFGLCGIGGVLFQIQKSVIPSKTSDSSQSTSTPAPTPKPIANAAFLPTSTSAPPSPGQTKPAIATNGIPTSTSRPPASLGSPTTTPIPTQVQPTSTGTPTSPPISTPTRVPPTSTSTPTSPPIPTPTRVPPILTSTPTNPSASVLAASATQPSSTFFLPQMIRIPAGEFIMGSNRSQDPMASPPESPQHRVNTAEFLISRTEVTVAQFTTFVLATGYGADQRALRVGKDNHPVNYVSWNDAVAFCAWASQVTRRLLRLPSEAEWEKAARGTDGRIYPWGNNDPDIGLVNFSLNRINDTTPAGQYSPQGDSPYGCADMAGNLWEWTSSLYRPYPYNPNDGRESPNTGGDLVVRGGSFNNIINGLRCAYRLSFAASFRHDAFGFRIAASSI